MLADRIQTRKGCAIFFFVALSTSLSAQTAEPHTFVRHNFNAAQKAKCVSLTSHSEGV